MTTDILIQALREAFERAVHAYVDARITSILQQYAHVTGQFAADMQAVRDRITAIEDSDDRMADRLNSAQIDVDNLKQRVAALELRMPLNTDLNKIRELIDNKIEEALDAHANTYDHDEYDRIVGEVDDFDLDNIVTIRNLQDEVRDVLNSASFSVEVSL